MILLVIALVLCVAAFIATAWPYLPREEKDE